MFKRMMADESGVTALEYSLIVALLCATLVTTMPILTKVIGSGFGNVTSYMSGSK